MNNLPDQSDLQAKLHMLELKARYLRAAVEQATGQAIAAPQLGAENDLFADIDALEAHTAQLESRLGQPQQQAHTTVADDDPAGKPMSATEKCLTAKLTGTTAPTPAYTGATAKCLAAKAAGETPRDLDYSPLDKRLFFS